ncbi:hypothetical protein R3P38DRAFT_2853054 [Favolaschia claudopus]|uniref:Uncharacterized protein n=1 Tax=Favolaschia claudopus TaxID=2862362 RepID=A0AAW0DTK6_9AGAR
MGPDLGERVEWARETDVEAKRIQRATKKFVKRVVTNTQNDCCFWLVSLEWAKQAPGQ